jgi:hypothetical protein
LTDSDKWPILLIWKREKGIKWRERMTNPSSSCLPLAGNRLPSAAESSVSSFL